MIKEVQIYRKPSAKIFFTIVAWNYISYAATLMASIRRCHPDSKRYVIICGKPENNPGLDVDAEIFYSHQMDIHDVKTMAFVYDVMEYSTAIKPYAFLYFFKKYPDAHVLYTDPDLYFLKPLEHVFGALEAGAGLVLTPHIMRPLQDGKEPSDLTIMKSGVYNLGFLAARLEDEALLFIKWWADRCRRDAIVDIPDNKFTDQRWVDLAPAFVGAAYILRHPGYNIAYWNLASRKIENRDGRYTSNGEDVYFLHFSGVVPSNDQVISKHQTRFKFGDLPVFDELLKHYLSEIRGFNWKDTSKIKYEFNYFNDGRPVNKFMRLSFRRHEEREALTGEKAFKESCFFDQAEASLMHHGFPYISRVMYELWMARVDLQRAFDISDQNGRSAYLDWFIQSGGKEAGFDELSISCAEKYRGQKNELLYGKKSILPWKPIINKIMLGTKQEIEKWLGAPVPLLNILNQSGVYMPNILALLWESRPDLAAHFTLDSYTSLENYLSWCLTDGVLEKNVPIELIGSCLAEYLAGKEGDEEEGNLFPPKTRLVKLLKEKYKGKYRELVKNSPNDIRAQLAVAIWICGQGRAAYGWPFSMLASLVDWCGLPSPYSYKTIWIPNLIYACYLIRPDIQGALKIWKEEEVLRVLAWYIVYASDEYALTPDLLPHEFLEWLRQPCNEKKLLVNLEYLIWLAHPELASLFDLSSQESEAKFRNWLQVEVKNFPSVLVWMTSIDLINTTAQELVSCELCLTGLWGESSGRSEDIRITAECLADRQIDFIVFDPKKEQFFSADGQVINVDSSAIRFNIVHLNADTALLDYVSFQRAGLSKAYNVGYWAWELERLPEKWNFAYTIYDEIWATTHFAERAFSRNKVRPVFLMPTAVDQPKMNDSLKRSDFALDDDEFVFYYGFDFNSYVSRKNPEAAIEAFLNAFGKTKKKVKLLLKTMSGDQNNADYIRIKSLAEKDKRILLLDKTFDRSDLYRLISLCDVYVSPHRSEGLGRGPMEAMLLGVPVIATNYSGNIDFTTSKTAVVVDYDLVPVKEGEYPGGDGQVWAEIKLDELAKAMVYLFDNPDVCNRLSEAGRQFMIDKYNVSVVGERYASRINELFLNKKIGSELSPFDKKVKKVFGGGKAYSFYKIFGF